MATPIINHDVRSVGGSTLYMPAYYNGESGWQNMAIPNVYAADDSTAQYPCGTKYVEGDRVFYYGRYLGVANASATTVTATNGDDLAFKFIFTSAYQEDMADGLLVRKIADEQSLVYNTTVTVGRANDFYSGGWVCGKDTAPADERMFMRRITKQTYQSTATAGSTEIWNASSKTFSTFSLVPYTYASVLELDQPVINSKTGMATTIMNNPYKNIIWTNAHAQQQYCGTMGAWMHNDPTATYYGWMQTWGPMFCPHIANANEGASSLEHQYFLNGDGAVQAIDGATDTYALGEGNKQLVGNLYSNSAFEGGTGADEALPMLFLTVRG